jgi:hypothetical protein
VHVRYVCIALSILLYLIYDLHFVWGTVYFIPYIFSCYLEKYLQIFFWGWQLKHVGRLLFCLGISKPLSMRTGLVLPYMLKFFFFFSDFLFTKKKKKKKKKKKNLGRRCRIFLLFIFYFLFFLLIAFQILYVFLLDISVHFALIKYAYIWLRVYVWYLLSFSAAS